MAGLPGEVTWGGLPSESFEYNEYEDRRIGGELPLWWTGEDFDDDSAEGEVTAFAFAAEIGDKVLEDETAKEDEHRLASLSENRRALNTPGL